jgi:hypothetical protein
MLNLRIKALPIGIHPPDDVSNSSKAARLARAPRNPFNSYNRLPRGLPHCLHLWLKRTATIYGILVEWSASQ